MRKITYLLCCALLASLTACSSDQPAKSKSENTAAEKKNEAPDYISGRSAFQKLFLAARGFSPDVQPFRLQSQFVADAPTSQGKAGVWRGYFASPARREAKAFIWSGVSGPDMPDRGISHGTEDTWSPTNSSAKIWDIQYLKIDSDKAYEVAQKHGGEKLTKADAKQPVIFILDWDGSKLIWHVVYGTSANDAKLRIAVDASTGDFIRNEH